MVSIRDIAKECGVAVSTASKALNDQPDVSEETKKRVQAAADRMGYMANSAARALKTNRSYDLGVLLVDESASGLTHEYFASLLENFKAEAETHGYDLTFINSNVGGKPVSYLQHCRYRGVDGVVIACVDFQDPRVQELVDSSLPTVTIDHVFNDRLAVLSDNLTGMEALVDYVWEKGHRRIAYIHGENTTATQFRLTGFYRACEAHGVEIPEGYVVPSLYHDTEASREATQRLLAMEPRPTCIFYPDDFAYIGGQEAIIDAGLKIPEDISVVGYDGMDLARAVRLTTYRQNTKALGKTAARQLIALIEHPKTTVRDRTVVEGDLLEGNTVGIV